MNMNYILKNIYFLQLCQCALGSLPAPINVIVESLNFEHKLRWDPGPGSPPDTTYIVQYSPCHNAKLPLHVPNYMVAVVKQTLQQCTSRDPWLTYTIKVRASHHGKKSPWGETQFSPSSDTVLDPPVLTVSGCGDCLTLSITFPEFIQQVYGQIHYNISWKRAGHSEVGTLFMKSSRVELQYLERGMEYCVRVQAQGAGASRGSGGGLGHQSEEEEEEEEDGSSSGYGSQVARVSHDATCSSATPSLTPTTGYSGSAGLWSGMAEQGEPLWRVGAQVDVVKNMGGEEDAGTELGK
ncbi:hypothetical protein JZ751_020274, partial [Albula glossodonta]